MKGIILGLELYILPPADVPTTVQERAWSSPIKTLLNHVSHHSGNAYIINEKKVPYGLNF